MLISKKLVLHVIVMVNQKHTFVFSKRIQDLRFGRVGRQHKVKNVSFLSPPRSSTKNTTNIRASSKAFGIMSCFCFHTVDSVVGSHIVL